MKEKPMIDVPKDYNVEIKVKNNLLYKAMLEEGYQTAAELSRASGLSQSVIGDCLNLKTPLYSKNNLNEFRKCWGVLSKTLRRLPEDLLPKAHHYSGVECNKRNIEANMEDIQSRQWLEKNSDPQALLEKKAQIDSISAVLNTLTEKEKIVLEHRFGLNGKKFMTLEDVGTKIGVTRSRVREIEMKAIRKLRHPQRHQLISY